MDVLEHQKRIKQFMDWFELWQKLFNWSQLEDQFNLPKKSIYKHFNGHQPLPWKSQVKLYEGIKQSFNYFPPGMKIFIDEK